MSRSSWPIVWTAFGAGVVATIIQFSIPPILPLLQNQHDISYTNSGLLMSLFALTTLLTAVPSGFVIQKHGVRKIGVIGLAILLLGIVFNFFSTTFFLLIIARMIQGIGFGLISVAAPSAIGQFVDHKIMSLAMGIWSTWVPVGSLLMFFVAPTIVSNFKVETLWTIIIILILIVAYFYLKIIPKEIEQKAEEEIEDVSETLGKTEVKKELKNTNIWWVAVAFASLTFSLFAFNTWIPTYLTDTTSVTLVTASWIPSVVSLFMIGSNMYAGLFLGKFRNNIMIFIVPALVTALLWPMFMIEQSIILYSSAILLGLSGGFVPTIIFASAPLLAKSKETVGIAMSIIIVGENAGILIGPTIFGAVRDVTGDYIMSFWLLTFSGFITLIAAYKIWKSKVF